MSFLATVDLQRPLTVLCEIRRQPSVITDHFSFRVFRVFCGSKRLRLRKLTTEVTEYTEKTHVIFSDS